MAGLSAQGLLRPKSGCQPAGPAIERLGCVCVKDLMSFWAHLGCWQNSVPFCCGMDVLVFCLANAGGHSQLLEASCIPWLPTSSKPAKAGQVFLTLICLSPPLCLISVPPATESSRLLRSCLIRVGPTGIIQDSLPLLNW